MSGRPAFSFVSQCPYAQFTRNDTVVSQSSVDNEGKGREKKKRTCHPNPGNSAGDTPSTRSSVHLSNPRTRSQPHVNSFNPFLWMCFSYAWLFKRVYPFLFFLHPVDLVCRSPVCLDVPPLSHCSFSPFHQRPGRYVEKEGS